MEQSIWMTFGVIGMIITLGIIGNLLYSQSQTYDNTQLDFEVKKLARQSDFLCSTSPGNTVDVPITLFHEMTLTTQDDKVCVHARDFVKCEFITCSYEYYELELNDSLTQEFRQLDFNCEVEAVERGLLALECEG